MFASVKLLLTLLILDFESIQLGIQTDRSTDKDYGKFTFIFKILFPFRITIVEMRAKSVQLVQINLYAKFVPSKLLTFFCII